MPRGGRRAYDRPGRHPVVLVAESYAAAREPYVRYLRKFGFLVEEAAEGEQALAAIAKAPPHIILAERGLPRMSAARLAGWLSQNWRTRRIPMIVLTGDVDPSGAPEAEAAFAAALLVKPFRLSELLEAIRRALRDCQL